MVGLADELIGLFGAEGRTVINVYQFLFCVVLAGVEK
jgi:hypothetical protein